MVIDNDAQTKILQLLDVIAVEVAANRIDTTGLRTEVGGLRTEVTGLRNEVRSGFDRVDRRLDSVATELHDFRGEFERRMAPLEFPQ